jgi:hypothetical protein
MPAVNFAVVNFDDIIYFVIDLDRDLIKMAI